MLGIVNINNYDNNNKLIITVINIRIITNNDDLIITMQ